MSDFNVIVIGGGSGLNVASAAADRELDVAIVEKGPLGGTCLTRGCDPSKTLIHRADIVEQITTADAFGIDAEVHDIDLDTVVKEANKPFDERAEHMENELREADNSTLYKAGGRFVDERTLAVDDEVITGETVIIAVGARPRVPAIDGLDDVECLTTTEALRPTELPEHLIVIGGGLAAVELGHFYGTLGSDITIIGKSNALIPREDHDVNERFTDIFDRRYDVRAGYRATAVEQNGDEIAVHAETTNDDDGDEITVTGDELLVAVGREPNADRLDVETAGIETDDTGHIETNEYFETTADGVWAFGDVIGTQPYWHAALHEAKFVVQNALDGERDPIDYTGMSHAIFSSPQIASLGRTEGELHCTDREYIVGRAAYTDIPMGIAMKADEGFVKVLAAPDDGEILGCHIIGPNASALIHEVVAAITHSEGRVSDITELIHVHPALNEVLDRAFADTV